jgi:hypothetical protein
MSLSTKYILAAVAALTAITLNKRRGQPATEAKKLPGCGCGG